MANRAAILLYHLIDHPLSAREKRHCCTPENFRKQMKFLFESEFSIVELHEIVESIRGKKTLHCNAVAITFDDGFESIYTNALPVLEEFQLPATVFVVADRVGQWNDWMHAIGLPRRTTLPLEKIKTLASCGIKIGSHSMSHQSLPDLGEAALVEEVAASKKLLEELVGTDIPHFAYPYGRFTNRTKEVIAASGYEAACSTQSGFNNKGTDLFQLRRINVLGADSMWQFKQKLIFGANRVTRARYVGYYLRRAIARAQLTR